MVLVFCLLLIAGIIGGQLFDVSASKDVLSFITSVCLAYIMIEVGLEFSVDKRKIRSYEWDACVAFIAAALPTLLWFLYFSFVMQHPWRPSMVAGLSAAPTSAGVLFSMLLAAGLGATWVFQKARTLAVLDDLATILLLTPLGIIIHGFEIKSIIVLALIGLFLFASFRWQNTILWPTGEKWLLLYGFVLTAIVFFAKETTNIHLEVLIPAFMWGCLVHLQKKHHTEKSPPHNISLDSAVKGIFMILVGFSFPRIEIGAVPWGMTVAHVVALTILSNIGKCFSAFCYRREASLKERLALSVAMFPRGEVGAAVLLIGLGYGFGGYVSSLALLSLALNLVLTGVFIGVVMHLLRKEPGTSV
ncbi:MAG: cation:proton antiporter [Candidatus Omnitrophota bacterium]